MATRSLGTLTLDLVLRMGGFQQGANKAEREMDKLTRSMRQKAKALTSAFGGIAAGIAGGFGAAEIIRATAEAESALAKLDAAVKANGGSAGRTTEQLAGMATQLQSVSIFSDEAIQSAQALLLRFRSIQGVNFDRATETVLDLAAALDQDLTSVAKLLGRALEDPEAGMSRLARAGVIFSEEQKKVIKSLVDTGKTAEAQTVILDSLASRFGNASEAARNNFGGALIGLKNAFGDLLEAKGGLPEATAKLEELAGLLGDPETKAAADQLTSTLISGFVGVAKAIAETTRVLSAFGEAVAKQPLNDIAYKSGAAFRESFMREAGKGDIFSVVFGGAPEKIADLDMRLAALKKRRDDILALNPARYPFFGDYGKKELAEVEENLRAVERLKADALTSKPAPPAAATVGNQGTGVTLLTPEQTELREKLIDGLENARSAQEKYNEAVKEAKGLFADNGLTQEELTATLKRYGEELDKATAKGAGGSKATTDALQAQAKAYEDVYTAGSAAIEALRTPAEEQAAKYAEMRYALEQLALAFPPMAAEAEESLGRLNAQFGPAVESLEAMQAEYLGVYEAGVAAMEGLQDPAEQLLASFDEQRYALERLIVKYPELAEEATASLARLQTITAEKLFPKEEQDKLSVFFEEASRGIQNILADFIFDPFKDGLKGLAQSFSDMLLRMAAEAAAAKIAESIFGTGGAGSGGGWAGTAIAAIGTFFKGKAEGGYTGDGGKYQPAGIVHRGEYVVNAARVRKPGMRSLLESNQLESLAKRGFSAWPKGKAEGGYVGDERKGEFVASSDKVHVLAVHHLLREIQATPHAEKLISKYSERHNIETRNEDSQRVSERFTFADRSVLERTNDILRSIERTNDTLRSSNVDRSNDTLRSVSNGTSVLREVDAETHSRSVSDIMRERASITVLDRVLSQIIEQASPEREVLREVDLILLGAARDTLRETITLLRDRFQSHASNHQHVMQNGFETGGYTGDGGKYQPAGIVHRGEYVVNAERVRRPGVLNLLASNQLESFAKTMRGFSSGGLVGASIPMAVPAPTTAKMTALSPMSTSMNVTQQFAISAPTGTVSSATQQQIAAAAARGLAAASRRNN